MHFKELELPAVLGIDAAWSERHPSGLALVLQDNRGWRCVGLAPSYEEFLSLPQSRCIDWQAHRRGGTPNPERILMVARELLGGDFPDAVAVDMPLARTSIDGRRLADNLLSKQYGAKGCAVHTPTGKQLALTSRQIRDGFARHGFTLATLANPGQRRRCLLEVYPHATLLALLDEDYRIPYKVTKARKYWPKEAVHVRKEKLLHQFHRILTALRTEISDIELALPRHANVQAKTLKAYEDVLDALVCAWSGVKFLRGQVRGYGDSKATIWVPIRW